MGSEQPRGSAAPKSEFVIEAVDIVKRFGHVQALSGASLQVRPGEVLALVVDNGAGKSTLTKIICWASDERHASCITEFSGAAAQD